MNNEKKKTLNLLTQTGSVEQDNLRLLVLLQQPQQMEILFSMVRT